MVRDLQLSFCLLILVVSSFSKVIDTIVIYNTIHVVDQVFRPLP